MPRIFVAYRTSDTDDEDAIQRIADGSKSNLWKRLRAREGDDEKKSKKKGKKAKAEGKVIFADTEWTVAFYNIKADVKTIVQIIEDLSEVQAESVENIRVNEHGQVRKTD